MFPGMDMFSKMIPAKKAFSLVAWHIQSELKIKCEKYDLLFNVVQRSVTYTIYSENVEGGKMTLPFKQGEKYIDMAKEYLTGKVPEGCSIDSAMIQYDQNGETVGFLFYQEGEEKKSLKHIF